MIIFFFPQRIIFYFSKCTRIEIYLITSEGLQLLHDIGIYGRISTMELFRPNVFF